MINYSREYQESQSLYRHSNRGPLKYDSGVLITKQQRTIYSSNKDQCADVN
jgi:hypothetical protein